MVSSLVLFLQIINHYAFWYLVEPWYMKYSYSHSQFITQFIYYSAGTLLSIYGRPVTIQVVLESKLPTPHFRIFTLKMVK